MSTRALILVAPELEAILAGADETPAQHDASAVRQKTVQVEMRDGTRLATDLYLPPAEHSPSVTMRTPYGRGKYAEMFLAFARRGYAAVSQDCRGTGDSEPDHWDYTMFEQEDSFDFVEWVSCQDWFDGFIGSCGGSYIGQTQWCMAMHPAMSAIAPEVSGLGVVATTRPRLHMFVNAYSRSVGRGREKASVHYEELERQMVDETLATGYFNEPLFRPFGTTLLERYPELRALGPDEGQRWLWERYAALPPAERAELVQQAVGERSVTIDAVEAASAVFGHRVSHDAHHLPRADVGELVRSLRAPALLITGWYDWGLDDTLATWELLTTVGTEPVRSGSRLLVTAGAHDQPGYREGVEDHAELARAYRGSEVFELLLYWYTVARGQSISSWPEVIYYLMGANEWRTASAWPPPDASTQAFYLGSGGTLTEDAQDDEQRPDSYIYDPADPTPTVGGSIVSYVIAPGSVDVSEVQRRPDVLVYTTELLEHDVDVVGPMRLVLYASSSAVDTDFSARLSDVFPDGRAIQLQSVTLRARYRNPKGEPELLEPGRIYRLEIDMWSTANRFHAGHRLRLDISSADFPKYDRNTNRGGAPGPPIRAEQSIYHDPEHPSLLLLHVLDVEPDGVEQSA